MTAISTDFCHDIKRLSRPGLAAIASHSLSLFVYVDGIGTIELHNSFTVTYFTGLAMFFVLTFCYSADKVLRRSAAFSQHKE